MDTNNFFIRRPVAVNSPSDPGDILHIKEILKKHGYYEEPEYGMTPYTDEDLFRGIRAFQEENGLKVDGVMKPGGETAMMLAQLEQQARDRDEELRRAHAKQKAEEVERKRIHKAFEETKTVSGKQDGEGASGISETGEADKHPQLHKLQQPPAQKTPPLPERKPTPSGQSLSDGEKTDKKPKTAGTTDLFRHYKEGSRRHLAFTDKEMEQRPSYSNAMQINRKRFEDSMVLGKVQQKDGTQKHHSFHDQIINLKDGESIVLDMPNSPGGGDYWDRDIKRYEGVLSGDLKQAMETGSIKLRSTGTFQAKRKGGNVYISGVVDHRVKDVFDFNKDDPEFRIFRNMAEKGKAKPFSVHGSKLEQIDGKISIKNGQITGHDFKWIPVDPKDIR